MTQHTSTPSLTSRLRAARRRLRRWLATVASLRLAGWVFGLFILLALLDYLLRLPPWIRWVNLLIGLGAIVWAFRKTVLPALGFRPSLSDVALQIERERPDVRGRLASAIELESLAKTTTGVERELAGIAAARSIPPTGGLLDGLLDRRTMTRTLVAVLAIVGAGALAAFLEPSTASTAAVRTAAPWSGVAWPKRAEVRDITALDLHPRDEPVPLRAALTRSHRPPDETDVAVRLRYLEEGVVVRRSRLLASWQQREIGAGLSQSGQLFEALADADADELEYRFETLDDATPWTTIRLVERPTVIAASARIRRPAYLIASAPEDEPESVRVDLGPGSDERAVAPASLAGSTVEFTLTLNKPVTPHPSDSEWLSKTLGSHAGSVTLNAAAAAWTIAFPLDEPRVFRVGLRDENDIESAEPAVFRFPAQRDQPPSVVVTNPAYDDTVLPQAIVDLAASATDDVALAALWSSAQRFAPAGDQPSGRGGAVEPAGDERVLQRASVSAGELRAEVSSRLSLAELEAQPGDEVHLWATAADVYAFETGAREPVRSSVRRLFIVSEEEFIEDVRGALSGVRREAIRLFEGQRELTSRASRAESDASDTRRQQEALTRDIERQSERLAELRERISSNNLDDDALDALTEDAQRLAESAAESSENAAEAAQRQQGAEQDQSQGEQEREATQRAQERTLDDLGELIALLDSGEDAWTARRNLERLLNEQRENLDATREQGRETAGLAPEELTEEQRENLERISDRQAELAEQSRAAQQALRETQEALEESDPSTSAALEQAAQSLERSDVSRRMEEAAQQAQQNRTSRSAALQEEAVEQLEEALAELDDAERARDEQLRRLARSLVETIEGLIASQQDELARLERNEPALDRAMIALHTRTIAAAEMAATERELRPAARPLEDAADAQLQAVSALRAQPAEAGNARDAEAESLARLEEALEEAQRLQQEIEEEALDRERDEIKEAYRQALEAQTALRERTRASDPAGGEPDRRARAELRRIAAEQSDLAGVVADLYTKTQELSDAVVFKFAHEKLDDALARASENLRAAEATQALDAQSRAIVLLRSLIDALEEEQPDEEQFDDGGGGGGGGGQQGAPPELIPGGAQLKLLRAIQSDLLDRTRAIDEGSRPGSDLPSVGAEQRELSEIGQTLIDELTQQQQPPIQLEPSGDAQEGAGS